MQVGNRRDHSIVSSQMGVIINARPVLIRSSLAASFRMITLAVALLGVVGPAPSIAAQDPAPATKAAVPGVRATSPVVPVEVAPLAAGQDFELTIVGPDGKPVPRAVVEFRVAPLVTADRVHRGKFVRDRRYGSNVEADEAGRLAVAFPAVPSDLDIDITVPGFGPYWARWRSQTVREIIPVRFTAELEAGWAVGGVVVDSDGRPVAGAKIHSSIEFKKRPGDTQQFSMGATPVTDAGGRWHFDSVPASLLEFSVRIDHPEYRPLSRRLSRGGFEIERGAAPTAQIALARGITVTGTITDDSGKPIAGAKVRTKFLNEVREARTERDGTYNLVGCEPVQTRIVVSASGRATDMQDIKVDPEMAPVDFRLATGRMIRVRVVNHLGRPEVGARIFFQEWRGQIQYFEFDDINQRTDEVGVWTWNEAPADEVRADICPAGPDGMQLVVQPLVARAEEYRFRLPPTLIITGTVVDAETRAPIPRFSVVPGGHYPNGVQWHPQLAATAINGHFDFRGNRSGQGYLVRIEADGYLPLDSREVAWDEGTVPLTFELRRGAGIVAKILTPDLKPAAGARAALGTADVQIGIVNGQIDDSWTYGPRQVADAGGFIRFPRQKTDYEVIITHPAGYAEVRSSDIGDSVKIIRLQPWSQVEGTYRIGRGPGANIPLELSAPFRPARPGGPHIYTQYETTTGPDGRFVFDRVVPGGSAIARKLLMTTDDGARDVMSSHRLELDLPAGKTVHIDLGGTGRLVIGQLVPHDLFVGKPRWSFAVLTIMPDPSPANPPPSLWHVTLDDAGTFRIEDLPPGNYTMFLETQVGKFNPGTLGRHSFQVPEIARDEVAERPVDLGMLRLKAQ